ncbi:site-specific DNA-methyltransferase [bacterium]|nr:site-specific DNA-methyltransferase [bacterium]
MIYRSYFWLVKLIYIDTPYNTGKDFIYPDNFADPLDLYLKLTGQRTENGDDTTNEQDKTGRFHSGWLSMMYPRLSLARQFLQEDGLIMVSIDDREAENLKRLLKSVFGDENYVATFVWKRKAGGGDDSEYVASEHEYVICFARDIDRAGVSPVFLESPAMTAKYNRSENGRRYYLERLDKTSLTYSPEMDFPIECPDGTFVSPPQPNPENPTTAWRWGKKAVKERHKELVFQKDKKTGEWRVYTKTWEPTDGITPRTLLVDKIHGRNRDGTQELSDLIGPKIFNNPKPTKMLKHLVDIGAGSKDALVMDFFAGSGSLADAVFQKNQSDEGTRRTVSVQMPFKTDRKDFPTISSICEYRLKAALKRDYGENYEDEAKLRVFRLRETNLRKWNGIAHKDPDAYAAQLEAFTDSLAPGWQPQEVIWEVALREGYSLTAKVEELDIDTGPTFLRVSDEDRSFVICLDEALTLDAVAPLGLTKNDMFVCRDAALDDTLAANLALQCRLKVI